MDLLTKYFMAGFLACLIQFLAMKASHARRWSKQAMIRNVAIACSIVAVCNGVSPAIFLVVLLLECLMEYINCKIVAIDPWLTTAYLYNDYFESVVNGGIKAMQYYSEGSYSKSLGLCTTDLTLSNVKKVIDYGSWMIDNADLDQATILHSDGKSALTIDSVTQQAQQDKFDWIVEKCGIQPGTRVLEIGFGKADLMNFLRAKGALVSGINLSREQVEQAASQGFHVVCCNFWDMLKHKTEIGTDFDVIIANGSLEYYKLPYQPHAVYSEVFSIIKQFLKSGGKCLCTALHFAEAYPHTLKDLFLVYMLWSGNDGCYPKGRDGLTKHALDLDFKIIHQENRWLDYYLYSCLWLVAIRKRFKKSSAKWKAIARWAPLLIANPHIIQSIFTYSSFNKSWSPWLWQFCPRDDYHTVPTTTEYIVFQRS